jgi:ribosome-associated heat shock protein Hsp15
MLIRNVTEVRIDTYLWAIRMYKTRTQAAEAIKGGKIKVGADNVKPARIVKVGDAYTLSTDDGEKKTIEVTALIDKRQSYEIALQHYKDTTPVLTKEQKLSKAFFNSNITRDRGAGRPTKKDRRDINDIGMEDDDDN